MVEKPLLYYSYLLRLWQVDNHEMSLWRCSLENAQTGDYHTFASLTHMLDFLKATINECENQSEDNGRPHNASEC